MKPPIDVLLRGEESGGRLALVEMDVPAGSAGPPLHVHETWDEGFYVVAGEIAFQAGDRRVTARPGMFVFAPRETPHTFANLSGTDARMLIVLTPAGFEPYLVSGERPPPNTRAVGPAIGGCRGPPCTGPTEEGGIAKPWFLPNPPVVTDVVDAPTPVVG